MKEFIDQLQVQLDEELLRIQNNSDSLLSSSKRSVEVVGRKLDELKSFMLGYEFNSKDEEILFFKKLHPVIYARLIYHLRIFNVESRQPKNCPELCKTVVENELKEISHFFIANLDFYKYRMSNADYLDEQYFTRESARDQSALDEYSLAIDVRFSTAYSCKLARILAYEMLEPYLKKTLEQLNEQRDTATTDVSPLTWTAPKTALIEMLYALQSSGVFNNGQADLKQIARFLETMFSVELGNYYRTFQDIRIRKSGRTNFLDQLKSRLVQRMDEADEMPSFR